MWHTERKKQMIKYEQCCEAIELGYWAIEYSGVTQLLNLFRAREMQVWLCGTPFSCSAEIMAEIVGHPCSLANTWVFSLI